MNQHAKDLEKKYIASTARLVQMKYDVSRMTTDIDQLINRQKIVVTDGELYTAKQTLAQLKKEHKKLERAFYKYLEAMPAV